MDEKHSLSVTVRRCMETGEVLRPADYPRGYYFLLSPPNESDLSKVRLCIPGSRGAASAGLTVDQILGQWVTLTMEQISQERSRDEE